MLCHAQGFYGVYGKVFATIRAEDIVHLDSVGETDYPPLGKVCGVCASVLHGCASRMLLYEYQRRKYSLNMSACCAAVWI